MGKKLQGVIFILVLGSVCTLLLMGIKSYTYPKIALYKEFMLKTTILDAAEIDYVDDNFQDVFVTNIKKETKDDFVYYVTPDGRYIFEFEGRGLWGMIQGVITLNQDLETMGSMRIVSQEETPGLGARISEEEFLSQFKNIKVTPRIKLVMRVKSTGDNEVDSISGATLTSAALIDMINESVEKFRKIVRN